MERPMERKSTQTRQKLWRGRKKLKKSAKLKLKQEWAFS